MKSRLSNDLANGQISAWIYYPEDVNTDPRPHDYEITGNDRYVMEHKDGYRRFYRESNAKLPRQFLAKPIGFPVVPWNEIKYAKSVNQRAVEQGIISQADYDYFYVKSK